MIEDHLGSAEELHELADPVAPGRYARVMEVTAPAVVLGSAQRPGVVDRPAAMAAGLQVTRRRSGGGAVLIAPGLQVWIDLLIEAGDPLWDDDVTRAAEWVGRTWARALRTLGFDDVGVHRGGLQAAAWSSLVCFAGLGPGEVVSAGRKVVGLSQRRSRRWIRTQTGAFHRWDPGALVDVLVLTPPERSAARLALSDRVATVPVGTAEAVLAALPS
ncbi:MAG: hypothetical protein ACE5GB_05430 [Acidimicrobiales bacterium]